MAAPRARPNRVLLWVWVVFSLVTLVFSFSSFISSVPVRAEEEAAMAHGGNATMRAGERVVIEVLRNKDSARTVASPTENATTLGFRGDVIYWTNATRDLTRDVAPFQNPEGRFGRALALVSRNASGGWDVPALALSNVTTLSLRDVPGPRPGGYGPSNVTLNLTGFVGDRGYIVKPDASVEPLPELVALDHVVGRVIRAVPAASVWVSLSLSVLGILVPLVLIITTHRGRGKAGLPGAGGATGPACPECGRPAVEGTEFCVRCGAVLPGAARR